MNMKQLVWFVLTGILLLHPTHDLDAQSYRLDTLAQSPTVALPVCMAFAPGSTPRFFFTEKNTGNIKIFENGAVRPTPFATLSVTSSGEQGLLGIALHPQYPDSPFVYVQYTRSGDRANVVVRLRDSSGVGVDPRTLVVCTRINTATNHNGGNCHFGPDGKLYVTFGDNATSSNAQDSSASNLRGKILRLNPDGSIPPDNPFAGTPFWSIGHRNSFDFTFDPLTGIMYCTENGPSCDDEVNRVPPRGNMGWPIEGNCTYTNNPAYVRPLYYFPSSPLPALTGIVVYRATAFPRLRGKLLFTGNSSPTLWTLTLTANGDTIVPGSFTTFFTYSTGFADVEVGPDGNIYLTNGPYSANRLLRLRPVAPVFTSSAPINATQDSLYLYTPTFNGTPPGLSLVVAPDGMTVDSTTWSIRWRPTNAQALQGMHPVTLRAENGAGFVDQSFNVFVANVNDPPGAFHLLSPSNDTSFSFTNTPSILFSWTASLDPDRDTVRYRVQVDTINTFTSPALRDTSAGTNLSLRIPLPRVNRTYFWRVLASDGQLTVHSTEVWRFIVTIVTSVRETKESETKVEQQAALEQNFPNPFNPTTTIQYTIPRGGYVRLAVFNLLGQEVATIFEGVQNAGTHEVTFNNQELPTGIYFYRIQAPGFVETRKMIITK
jgi:glucose/arabinose dehydrogenase